MVLAFLKLFYPITLLNLILLCILNLVKLFDFYLIFHYNNYTNSVIFLPNLTLLILIFCYVNWLFWQLNYLKYQKITEQSTVIIIMIEVH